MEQTVAQPQKVAVITGVNGQDGYYLSRLLAGSDVLVHGIVGPNTSPDSLRGHERFVVHSARLDDPAAMVQLIGTTGADYVFHLAGLSSVADSWSDPGATVASNALTTTTLLDACLQVQNQSGRRIAFVNASSGEIFAGSGQSPQTEQTPTNPTSPYGASKALGHMMCRVYRDYGLAASNAIFYNHESTRRPARFVSRKITMGVAAIARGTQEYLTLGNVSARRDWGWAPDYVDAMFRMATLGRGEDFIVASGETHSIAEFAEAAFAAVGIDNWRERVRVDDALRRPREPMTMLGDPGLAAKVLGWRATTSFADIVAQMVKHDLDRATVREEAVGGSSL